MKIVVLLACLLSVSSDAIIEARQAYAFEWQDKEYRKIEDIEVPAEILKSVSGKYRDYILTEAYVSEDGDYKLVLNKEDKPVVVYFKEDKPVVVYFKATGEFIKEGNIK